MQWVKRNKFTEEMHSGLKTQIKNEKDNSYYISIHQLTFEHVFIWSIIFFSVLFPITLTVEMPLTYGPSNFPRNVIY